MVNDIFTFKYKPKLLKDFYINSNLLEILTTFIQIEKITGNTISRPFIYNQNLFVIKNGSIVQYN